MQTKQNEHLQLEYMVISPFAMASEKDYGKLLHLQLLLTLKEEEEAIQLKGIKWNYRFGSIYWTQGVQYSYTWTIKAPVPGLPCNNATRVLHIRILSEGRRERANERTAAIDYCTRSTRT